MSRLRGLCVAPPAIASGIIYHAFSKVTGYPTDPRQGPFIGFPGVWSYQKAYDEGRRMAGGSVIDFLLYAGAWSSMDIAFRIQTERFHLYADMDTQVHDAMQFQRLSSYMRVIDLYDQDFVWDRTNQAAIVLLKDALAGSITPNPINSGTTWRASRVRMISV